MSWSSKAADFCYCLLLISKYDFPTTVKFWVTVNSQISLYWAQNPRQGILELASMTECFPKVLPAEEELTTTEKHFVTEVSAVRKESWSDQQKRGTGFSAQRGQLCYWPLKWLWTSHLSLAVPHVSPHPKMLMTSSLKCFEIEVWSEYCYSLAGGTGVFRTIS